MASTVDGLAGSKYLLVTSYRRDGRAVGTPVWVVRDNDALGIWTPTASGKVKRIRRNPSVRVGPCDVRGQLLGEQIDGTATVLDDAGTERIRRLMRRKYGIIARFTVLLSRLRRGRAGTVGISISLGS